MLDWSCKAKNQMKQKAHTSVLWLMLSFRKHNSRLKGSCNGFPSSLLWSIGLSANHSLMNALKTLQKAGIFFKSRVLDLTSLEEHKGEFNSSCRKFSKSGLGLESCPGTQLYKWIRPVCRLTCKRWWHFRGIYRRNCQFTPLNSSLGLDLIFPNYETACFTLSRKVKSHPSQPKPLWFGWMDIYMSTFHWHGIHAHA